MALAFLAAGALQHFGQRASSLRIDLSMPQGLPTHEWPFFLLLHLKVVGRRIRPTPISCGFNIAHIRHLRVSVVSSVELRRFHVRSRPLPLYVRRVGM